MEKLTKQSVIKQTGIKKPIINPNNDKIFANNKKVAKKCPKGYYELDEKVKDVYGSKEEEIRETTKLINTMRNTLSLTGFFRWFVKNGKNFRSAGVDPAFLKKIWDEIGYLEEYVK